MASKINANDLKVGMFVADLDRPWVDTPFLLQGFLIENEEQILALRTHCEWVMIDRARSTGAEFEAVSGISPATNTMARKPAARMASSAQGIDPEAVTPLSAPIEEKKEPASRKAKAPPPRSESGNATAAAASTAPDGPIDESGYTSQLAPRGPGSWHASSAACRGKGRERTAARRHRRFPSRIARRRRNSPRAPSSSRPASKCRPTSTR